MRQYRRLLLRVFKKSLNKIRISVMKNSLSGNDALTNVSYDFRKFLSAFTQINCFTMVPKEFLLLPKMMNQSEIKGGEIYIFEHAELLYRIFKSCDDLRFSGNGYERESVFQVLDAINLFITAFESCEKEYAQRGKQNLVMLESAS
jgi:hypothetical protein